MSSPANEDWYDRYQMTEHVRGVVLQPRMDAETERMRRAFEQAAEELDALRWRAGATSEVDGVLGAHMAILRAVKRAAGGTA